MQTGCSSEQKKNKIKKKHSTRAWRLDLLCLGKVEIRYKEWASGISKRRFGQAWRSQHPGQGKPLFVLAATALTRFSQSMCRLYRECHHPCPLSNVSSNLLPWDWDGEAQVWMLPIDVNRHIYKVLDPANAPSWLCLLLFHQGLLFRLFTVNVFSQLVRTGNNSPGVNILCNNMLL